MRKSRALKRRLVVAAEHFNRSPKKGIPYMQEYGLLPENLTSKAVAKFLKLAPGLDKEVVGEYLGDPKDFQVEVLKEYADLFNFENVTLDKALRTFLDGFKLPGEAQKISRILEAYAARYFGANPNSCADADSAYVLSYSIIMLNTDAHNKQVKKKMTLEQFIRNNRGTNGGKDWPKETLVAIFDSIVTDEIRLTDDAAPKLSNSAWHDVMRACKLTRGNLMRLRMNSSRANTMRMSFRSFGRRPRLRLRSSLNAPRMKMCSNLPSKLSLPLRESHPITA